MLVLDMEAFFEDKPFSLSRRRFFIMEPQSEVNMILIRDIVFGQMKQMKPIIDMNLVL